MGVRLRPIVREDLELILAWRNNPLIYSTLYSQGVRGRGAIPWDEHAEYWRGRLSSKDWECWLIEWSDSVDSRVVGYLQLNLRPEDTPHLKPWVNGKAADMGYYVGELGLWGKGIGQRAVQLGIDWLRENGYTQALATVVTYNYRGCRLIEGLGFVKLGESRPQEWVYSLGLL